MKGRDKLFLLEEYLGATGLLNEIIQAMSEQEAFEMAEFIDRMHGFGVFDEEDEEKEEQEDE